MSGALRNNPDPDHEWFMEQVRREQAGLRAFIRSLGLRAEVVDDVAQEAFVVAFQKLQTFERGTNFGAWLRTIARFLASRELRREERRQRLLGEEVAGLLVESLEPAHPAAAAEAGVRMAALQACLAELPERGRRLLQQRYFDNLTPTLIASLEGRTANDVRQALFRLRAALHACIRRRLEAQP
jgi:RNA polymerase sigma-70 factor (ECF subfamily)